MKVRLSMTRFFFEQLLIFFFFFQVGNLSNDIQFQMCELGIFDVNSRKKWAVMLWTVESLPILSCAL